MNEWRLANKYSMRAFESDDIAGARRVDLLDERGERRRFAGSGGPRDDDQAARGLDELAEVRVQVAHAQILHARRQQPDGHRDAAHGLKEIGAQRGCRRRIRTWSAEPRSRNCAQPSSPSSPARPASASRPRRPHRPSAARRGSAPRGRVGLQMQVACTERVGLLDPLLELHD